VARTLSNIAGGLNRQETANFHFPELWARKMTNSAVSCTPWGKSTLKAGNHKLLMPVDMWLGKCWLLIKHLVPLSRQQVLLMSPAPLGYYNQRLLQNIS